MQHICKHGPEWAVRRGLARLLFLNTWRVSSNLLGPVDPSFRDISGRYKLTVRRHKFSKYFSFGTVRSAARPFHRCDPSSLVPDRCRANMAHVRQSRPESSLGFQVTVLKPCEVVPSSLGSGRRKARLGTLGPW